MDATASLTLAEVDNTQISCSPHSVSVDREFYELQHRSSKRDVVSAACIAFRIFHNLASSSITYIHIYSIKNRRAAVVGSTFEASSAESGNAGNSFARREIQPRRMS